MTSIAPSPMPWTGTNVTVRVTSAHPLGPAVSQVFESRFRAIFPCAHRFSFTEDARLLAGVRVIAGPWNLGRQPGGRTGFFPGTNQ